MQNSESFAIARELPSPLEAHFELPKVMGACRKCSHCGGNGHNSRTCAERGGVKLFGVRIFSACGSMRKSVSTGNLIETTSPSPCSGYVSEGLPHTSRQRMKGVPWSEVEHKLFLLALRKLGKGDWRGISKRFVKTRTPTQVASHAQKYFLRQSNLSKRKRRSSLFDMAPDSVAVDAAQEACEESDSVSCKPQVVKDISSTTRELSLPGDANTSAKVQVSKEANHDANHDVQGEPGMPSNQVQQQPPYASAQCMQLPGWKYAPYQDTALFFSYHWSMLQGFLQLPSSASKIVRPIPVTATTRVKIVGTSLEAPKLSNGKAGHLNERTLLSHGFSVDESRQSAFHTLKCGSRSGCRKSKPLVQYNQCRLNFGKL